MIVYATYIAFGMLSIALVMNFYRIAYGPTLPDRIIGLDTMYINTVAMIVLIGIHLKSDLFFEVALLIAMMGFIGTVALSKFVLRGDILEP